MSSPISAHDVVSENPDSYNVNDENELLEAISRLQLSTLLNGELKHNFTKPTKSDKNDQLLEIKKSHQCYFNWMDSSRFQEESRGITPDGLIDMFNDKYSFRSEEQRETKLKYKGIDFIAGQACMGFVYFIIGELIEAKAAIAGARDNVQICSKNDFVGQEHLNGIDYVLDCLEIYIETHEQQGKEDLSEFVERWKSLPPFESFDAKSEAAIWAMKMYCFENLRKDPDTQIDLIRTMINLDPDNYEWHHRLASMLRFKRREKLSYNKETALEFQPEVDELCLSKTLRPNHPECMIDYCLLVAEMTKCLKQRGQNWFVPLVVGDHEFRNINQVANFLEQECRLILEIYDISSKINLTIAEIFMKWLPKKCRNFKLALECFTRALTFHPRSSKGNHRMAIYHLTSDSIDILEAEKYCQLALEYDNRNAASLGDLLSILFGKFRENESKITDLFDAYLGPNRSFLSPHHLRRILFLKGCFLHLKTGNEREAVDCWLSAQETQGGPLCFDNLEFQEKRYQWPRQHLCVSKIRDTLFFVMGADPEFAKQHSEGLAAISKSLTDAGNRRNYFPSGHDRGRGNERGRQNRNQEDAHGSCSGGQGWRGRPRGSGNWNRGHRGNSGSGGRGTGPGGF